MQAGCLRYDLVIKGGNCNMFFLKLNNINKIIILFILGLLFLSATSSKDSNKKDKEKIDVKEIVVNPDTGVSIGSYRGWIYKKEKGSEEWEKLIPGRNPAWFPNENRFYYFLAVGYEGKAELWSALDTGEDRLKMSDSYYQIFSGNLIVSKDGKALAYYYSTCMASGNFEDVVVIFLEKPDGRKEVKVALRKPGYTKIKVIEWVEDKVKVEVEGKIQLVSTDGEGFEPLP